jgi:hypothetical protein
MTQGQYLPDSIGLPLDLNNLIQEFSILDSSDISLQDFYLGGGLVPDNNFYRYVCDIPLAGPISYQNFYPARKFALTSPLASQNEGSTFNITLATTPALPNGSVIGYNVTGGITNDDLLPSGAQTAGNFTLTNGTGVLSFVIKEDVLTEGPEYLNLSLVGLDSPSISILINDTSRNFVNFDFSDQTTTQSGTTVFFNGWTAELKQVRLGIDPIGGFTTPADPTPNPTVPSGQVSPGDGTLDPNMSYSYQLLTSSSLINGSASGRTCIRLYSSGSVNTNGDVSHGPHVISNDYLPLNAGQTVEFDWRAAAGSDAYDIFAYLLKDDGSAQILLNQTQGGTSGDTGWLTVSANVNTTGNYKFVFVSGTFDYSFGGAAGASLYVTNIRVL